MCTAKGMSKKKDRRRETRIKLKAEDIVKLIRQRYPNNRPDGFQKYAVLEQVPATTGYGQRRWIDAVVFDLWPSEGLLRSAFEIKVSRSDFLRELQNPLKHKWVMDSFHEFWFVAPQNVIQLPELPPNVGWLYPRGGKLVVKRHAVKNPNPKLDDTLLAAFMRAAAKEIDRVSRTTVKEILDGSKDYRLATLYKAAVNNFINQRGVKKYMDPATPEEVVEWLNEATMDVQLQQDRDHLLQVAGRFQGAIISLLNVFLVVANKGLLARDELGNYIVSVFGGDDRENVETLKQCAKEAKHNDSQKRYVELIELVMNWDKELRKED
jgi:hypothetical protein